MEYVNFGSAGIKVSPLALGLGLRGQDSQSEAQRMIEYALDQGINLIDCANVYGTLDIPESVGQSEVVLGKALKGRRQDVVITSKVASRMGPGPNDSGLSRSHIMRAIEHSLKRLETDYIDVYLVHVFDPQTPLEETISALNDLVRSGKVRYVGCCNFAAWQVCKSLWVAGDLQAMPFMCVQNPYSLLNRELEVEMFGLLRDQRLGAMAYSPLAVGLLSGTYVPGQPAPADTLWATRLADRYDPVMAGPAGDVVRTLVRLAAEIGKSPAQLALAWVLSQPEITIAISGSDTIDQIDDAIGAVGWTLDDAIRQELAEVSASFVRRSFI
ncbi:MAG: aldo/keto reductase [Gemmatimonadetes bacterium]|jgi:aryl-alcohol dehydrogenase-like predicted oxidoreductase|nr:aldo/keto reductase [Gemmatimonadota bacterium]MBT4612801.1 aldo/keto reductase [Gemmatimonadota bacterium]MBT5145973.1 aldo/keto reductase [Gemmatimonadota bacterium]MBT5588182.1 aldo/keto reductase [Gemmatimonadota bacterium]MBT5961623.1 aldo/keto reductase [Gemmatimonadota bacterium]